MGQILLELLGPAVAVNSMRYLSEKETNLYLLSLSWFNFCEKLRFNSWFSVQAGKKGGNSLKGSTISTCLPYMLILSTC